MKAAILAAGEGARMGPFTVSEPKVMIPVANRPILEYVVEALRDNGVTDLVLVVGYRRERIMSHFQDGRPFGVGVEYVTQGKQLGTAHALWSARDALGDDFLVLNGSSVIDARTVADILDQPGPPAVLITESETPSKYGVVSVSGDALDAIVEKPSQELGHLINTGIYRFDRAVFAEAEAMFEAGKHDLPSLLQRIVLDRKVRAVPTKGRWIDALYPWDLLRVNAEVLKGLHEEKAGTIEKGVTIRGRVVIGEGSILRSGTYIRGPVVIGKGCEIGPNAALLPATSLGDNVVVGPFTSVENSILMDDVFVGPGSTLQDCVVGMGTKARAGLSAASGPADAHIEDEWHRVERVGALVGEDAELGSGVVVEPGTILGAQVKVRAGVRIYENVPNRGVVV